MAAHSGPDIVTDGLVLCLDAGNSVSYPGTGTTWFDLSGNGNNGTLVNSVSYDISNKGSLLFDASNEKVETTISSFGNNTTWNCWINRTSVVSSYNMFMGRLLPYFGFLSGNIIFSNIIGGSQRTVFSTGVSFQNNVWYNFTFTTEYNGTNTIPKLYINAVFNNSSSFSGSQGSHSGVFTIGEGRSTGAWYPYNGKVSNVNIYNRTLSPEEIQQNFNATRSRFGI